MSFWGLTIRRGQGKARPPRQGALGVVAQHQQVHGEQIRTQAPSQASQMLEESEIEEREGRLAPEGRGGPSGARRGRRR